MRFGRNVVRTLFEYYRFTNVLAVPMYAAPLRTRRKGRAKTHRERGRSRRRISPDVQPRPTTTRENAPISYNDLFIRGYESGSSADASPNRYATAGYNQQSRRPLRAPHDDQFSLLTIQASKFSQLDFSNEFRLPKLRHITTNHASLAPTKPRLDTNNINQQQYASTLAAAGDKINVVAPKSYVSIIDFNQITRGGLDRATQRGNEKRLVGKHK